MELGSIGMHNQLRQWAQQAYIASLLDLILDKGFIVYITSDHGNIEAEGCGSPSEGAVADIRGKRVRVYYDQILRSKVKEKIPNAMEWPSFGLPSDFLPLIAPDRRAFAPEGEVLVGHGGLSIEEVIVPLIQIERKKT
jgi:hypothetical protein